MAGSSCTSRCARCRGQSTTRVEWDYGPATSGVARSSARELLSAAVAVQHRWSRWAAAALSLSAPGGCRPLRCVGRGTMVVPRSTSRSAGPARAPRGHKIRAADDRRRPRERRRQVRTDVVPLAPITNREFARASQSQTVVVSESQSLNVVSWQTRRCTWAGLFRRSTHRDAREGFFDGAREGPLHRGAVSRKERSTDAASSPIPSIAWAPY